jgi:hypothetical protein
MEDIARMAAVKLAIALEGMLSTELATKKGW